MNILWLLVLFFQSKMGIYVEGTSSRTVKRGNKCVSEMSHSAVELFHTGLFTHAYVCVCIVMGVGGWGDTQAPSE